MLKKSYIENLFQTSDIMIDFPNAKINIGLNIKEKRTDGFHNIETIFYPLTLSDILEIQVESDNDSSTLTNTGLTVDTPNENNIVFKAFETIRKFNIIPEVNMHLHKIIPFGAGLCGGSSDAVFTLKILNELFTLEKQEDQLQDYAESLGSDCPFFLKNTPQYAFEKGNKMEPLNISLKGYTIILVVPNIQISTKFAYQGVKTTQPEVSLKKCIEEIPVKEWKYYIQNDFESHLFEHYKELKNIKDQLYQAGAVFASLSGSGSAIFGIFEETPPEVHFPNSYFTWEETLKY